MPGCRDAAAAACPRGRIFCLFDLPLTFAVTAGKADPIDFMWIMIFCRLPRNLLIVHMAIYSVLEWEADFFDGEVICTHVHGVEGHQFRYKCELLVTLPYFLFSDCGRHFKMDIF